MTEEGIKIKEEMSRWLENEFDIIYVEQEPPGVLFEYPFIKKAVETSIKTKEPVLYIHTKGAANKAISKDSNCLKECIEKPDGVNEYDWQPTVRNLWKHEFSGERLKEYIKVVNRDKPTVVCPFTGEGKITWYNGFMMNYGASLILSRKLKKSEDRFYFERMFKYTDGIEVVGMISNNCNLKGPIRKELYEETWKFYKTKN